MKKVCKQCGRGFELTNEDIDFYRQKGWCLPERCESCRRQNRANKERNIPFSNETTTRERNIPFSNETRTRERNIPFSNETRTRKSSDVSLVFTILVMVVVIVTIGVIAIVAGENGKFRILPPPETNFVAENSVPETTYKATEIILETEPPTTEMHIETTEPIPETTQAPKTEKVTEEPKIITYYLNTYRMKFHKPNCPSVTEMNPRNRKAFYGTREEAIEMGYSPCGNCRP